MNSPGDTLIEHEVFELTAEPEGVLILATRSNGGAPIRVGLSADTDREELIAVLQAIMAEVVSRCDSLIEVMAVVQRLTGSASHHGGDLIAAAPLADPEVAGSPELPTERYPSGSGYRSEVPAEVEARSDEILSARHNPGLSDPD